MCYLYCTMMLPDGIKPPLLAPRDGTTMQYTRIAPAWLNFRYG